MAAGLLIVWRIEVMKRFLIALMVSLVLSSLEGGQLKLRSGEVHEGDIKVNGSVVTVVEGDAVFQFKMKDVAELDGKVIEREKNPRVRIATSKGDIVVELFEDEAPNTVANFIRLTEQGFYKGLGFHRIIKGFMAQGGCPNSKRRGDSSKVGQGGPGYMINDEISPNLKHDARGILSMANSGPNTNGSQFFICFAPCPWLDGKHTVFGKVVSGMDTLDRLEAVGTPQNQEGKPKEDVRLAINVVYKRNHEYKVKRNRKTPF